MEFVKDTERTCCHDCKVNPGEYHLPGCDVERCPKCGEQLISCDCFRIGNDDFDQEEFEKYEQDIWSGIMFEDARIFAEQNNLFCYFDEDKRAYFKCDSSHPDATHDISVAYSKMPKFIPKLK